MKKKKNTKRRQKPSFLGLIVGAVLLLAAVLLGIMAASLIGGSSPATVQTPQEPSDTVETTAPSPVTELTIETTDEDMIVQTPFGKLYYPAALTEYMRVEQEIDGENVIIRYYGKLDDVEYTEVFSVWFGQEQELMCGTVTDETGAAIPVSIDMNLEIPGRDWTDNMKILTYSLQESVNHLMGKLEELDSFVRAE